MSGWFRVAVPLGIAAVLVSVLVIGFGSPSSHAAKPTADAPEPQRCMGDSAERVNYKGTASSTDAYQFDFCSDPTLALSVGLEWDNGKKDLALQITEPDGTQHLVDHHVGWSEGYIHGPPLPEGTWTVEVVNNDNGSVKYSLNIAFVPTGQP